MVKDTLRLSEFEDTIQQVVSTYKISPTEISKNGMTRDDFVSILRSSVWMLLKQREDSSRAYVCKAIWNKARDLLRAQNRNKMTRSFAPDLMTDICDANTISPWDGVNECLDVQKELDALTPKEVEIFWTTVRDPRPSTEVAKEMGIPYGTFSASVWRTRKKIQDALV